MIIAEIATQGRFQVVKSDHKDWDAYVRQHPNGSVFHTSAMIRAFAATRGIESYTYAATDADGNIVALLVSCHMHDDHMRSRALLSEVRILCEPYLEKDALSRCGYEHREYFNYVVDLQQDSDLHWKSLHKRVRQQIRGTHRRGVVVREDNTPEGIERLYKLLQASYGRARVPLLERDLFDNTLEQLPAECVRVLTALKDDEPVASVISLVFGNRVFSWRNLTSARTLAIRMYRLA